jgi:glycosyltransferase involved in cell wall biosynthesis
MKIHLTLHDDFNPNAGGMGVTSSLGDAFRSRGHEVSYLTFADLPQGLPFRAKFMLFPEFAAARLWRSDADVIDASCGDAWLWAKLRRHGRRGGGPLLVARSHGLLHIADIARREEAARGGLDLSWKYPLYWGGYRLREVAASYRSSDLCLFLNEEEREYGLAHFGLAEDRAKVVDNGLPEFLLGRGLEDAPDGSGALGIAHLGSYLPLKGVRYVVEGLTAVMDRHPQARATFLGTACPREQVLGDFRDDLRSRVDVVPSYRREDLPRLLSGHSVTVTATLQDGFHLGTLEAMACGLAPVVSATAGPLQYVRDDENGLVVPQADGEAIAGALEHMLADPALLQRLRTAANATAQHYSWGRIADETLALYREAMTARGGPG